MPYQITRYDGTLLVTIPDGTINTTSTSFGQAGGIPGKNYAGYGSPVDQNMVYLLENFAGPNPPANPLKGQTWFNTAENKMYICPQDNTTQANAWIQIVSTGGGNGSSNTTVIINEITHITDTTNSTAPTNGALIVDGGVGIGKDVHTGGDMYIAGAFYGDGYGVGNIQGANVVGNVTSAITANLANYAALPQTQAWTVSASAGQSANVTVTNSTNGSPTLTMFSSGAMAGLYDARVPYNSGNFLVNNGTNKYTFFGDVVGGNISGNINGANISNVVVPGSQGQILCVGAGSTLSASQLISLDTSSNTVTVQNALVVGGNITTGSGTVTALHFSGEAGNLTNLTGANVIGTVGAAAVAYAVSGSAVVTGLGYTPASTDGTNAGGTWPINITGVTTNTGSNGYGARIVSGGGPSGGNPGDIWLQIT